MSKICIIPARYHSSRFPGKLLEIADEKTILQRTWESALNAQNLDGVFVATDHEEIKRHIEMLGGKVLWTSPTPRNGTERIAEALRTYSELQKHDLIVNLQGDHPCTHPDTIDAIVDALEKTPGALLSTAVTPIESKDDFLSPHIVKAVFDRSGSALYFSRSPIPYQNQMENPKGYAHIGIYCYRKKFFDLMDGTITTLQSLEDLEQLHVLESGHKIQIAIVKETLLSVDTPKDLIKLKEFLCLKGQ